LFLWYAGIRVSEKKEQEGLDIGEHGLEAYQDFEKVTNIY
jgi:ammonia channel protein AmtB